MKKYALVALAAVAASAIAGPVTPTYGSFGNLAVATWGGNGIPTQPAAITTIGALAPEVTLGLIAHQRFSNNPPLGNNGAGTYFALPGIDTNAPSPANPYATWNFGFYIGGAGISNYTYALLYDFDPGTGTDEAAHGTVAFGALAVTTQNSWNLGMDFLDGIPVLAGVTQPTFPSFDPNANGQYTFALVAYSQGAEVGRSAIAVNVGDVPEPGSLALAGLALLGAVSAARRRSR